MHNGTLPRTCGYHNCNVIYPSWFIQDIVESGGGQHHSNHLSDLYVTQYLFTLTFSKDYSIEETFAKLYMCNIPWYKGLYAHNLYKKL